MDRHKTRAVPARRDIVDPVPCGRRGFEPPGQRNQGPCGGQRGRNMGGHRMGFGPIRRNLMDTVPQVRLGVLDRNRRRRNRLVRAERLCVRTGDRVFRHRSPTPAFSRGHGPSGQTVMERVVSHSPKTPSGRLLRAGPVSCASISPPARSGCSKPPKGLHTKALRVSRRPTENRLGHGIQRQRQHELAHAYDGAACLHY